jgi:hypothetical protein
MEEGFNQFYNEELTPLLLRVPGVLWAKRGVITGEGQKYIAVYEHESVEVQKTLPYRNALETYWAHKIRPYLYNFKREIYELF